MSSKKVFYFLKPIPNKVSVQPHFNQVHEEVKEEVQEIKEDPEEIALREQTEHFMKQKPPITISNVVCNYRCRTHLNLRDIALSTKHVIYKRFANAVEV